jgi:RNA polymerase sigma factor (sigma-70 family)
MLGPSFERLSVSLPADPDVPLNLLASLGINVPIGASMLRNFSVSSPNATTLKRSSDALDLSLMVRVVARDLRAFEALYRIYHPRLDRFLGLITPRRTIVEEALNDTMLVVWRRSDSFTGQCKVSTWIFAIAYRTALKALRTQDEPVAASLIDDLVSEDAGPEQRLNERQTRAALMSALETLSAEQRAVLILTFFHDLPYAEIARVVDCPIDTVKTRVFHGRRRLRAALHDCLGSSS